MAKELLPVAQMQRRKLLILENDRSLRRELEQIFSDLDVTSADTSEQAFAMTRPGGSYFVIGYGGTLVVPTLDVISTERNIIGNIVGTYNELAELMVLAEAGKVTLHTKTYALDDAQQALSDLDEGKVRGRAILVP